jgi:hypothetical protein
MAPLRRSRETVHYFFVCIFTHERDIESLTHCYIGMLGWLCIWYTEANGTLYSDKYNKAENKRDGVTHSFRS